METKLKTKLIEIGLAGILFFGILLTMPTFLVWWRSDANPKNWFVVNQFFIPDIMEKEKVTIIYDRDVKQSFNGRYVAEVQKVEEDKFYTVCSGHDEKNYTKDESLPPAITLKWFIKDDCELNAGLYRVVVVWNLIIPDYPQLRYETVSNVFTVRTPEDQKKQD